MDSILATNLYDHLYYYLLKADLSRNLLHYLQSILVHVYNNINDYTMKLKFKAHNRLF